MNKVNAEIVSLSHDGRGVAHVDGKAVFVYGALPGELVHLEIVKKRKKRDEAHLLEVIRPSDYRVSPFCKSFQICGGCAIQHISADQQIKYKQETHLNNLKKIGGITCNNILPPLTGSAYSYRRRARLGAKYVNKKHRVLVGFREKTHHFIADIDFCPVLVDKFADQITNLQALIEKMEIYNKIPQLELSAGDNATAIIVRHLDDLSEKDLEFLKAYGITENIQIYSQRGGPTTIKPLWPEDPQELYYSLSPWDIKIYFHPADFIQVNGQMNIKMIELAMELLDCQESDEILDLFCGIGNFSLPMAKLCRQVTAIEGDEKLVERGRYNANKNNIENINFFQADLSQDLDCFDDLNINKILLDPPRSGALEILPGLASLAAEKVVYVSCNSATFARDAAELQKLGYSMTRTGVMDMFPQTAHVECISLFEKV